MRATPPTSAERSADAAHEPVARIGVSASAILARSALALAMLGGCGFWYGHWTSQGGGWAAPLEDDHLSVAERNERQRAFDAMGVLAMQPVAPAELSKALDDMGLTAETRRALQDDLAGPAPAAAPRPVLVWIRLWDSEFEDGDVVRIDSAGYSRTLALTKRGQLLAVPISPGANLTITGIRDGDGGGITVGLASGASTALLPIMSTGQTLRIAVSLP